MADGSDRSDPAVRASLRLLSAERRHRMGRVSAALALFACAVIGPLVAQPLAGDPGATVGAIIASILLIGCGVMAWPWRWSDSEREHHTVAAVWAEARADAADPTPWTRFAAWAEARSDRVDLILVSHAGSAGSESVVGSFSKVVIRTVDADAIAEAATAMEALREEAARREERAQQRYREDPTLALTALPLVPPTR